MRAAILASLLFHARSRGETRRTTEFLARDFMPLLRAEEAHRSGAAPSPARQRQVALMLRDRLRMLAGQPPKRAAKGK